MIGDGVNGAPAMAGFGYTNLWLAIAAYTARRLMFAANALRLLRVVSCKPGSSNLFRQRTLVQ